jgi:ethanolaminephosphotransferase
MYFTGPPIERFDLGTAAFIPLMQGIVMFVYSVLDNSDGKQARKIQASSPLGLMMDHGCDILNTGIATITLTRIVSLGNNWMFPIVMIGTLGAFFFATLEEYFVGGLFLPIINGVNEGLMLVIAICIGTFFAPQNWWNTNSFISGFTWNDLLFWFLTIGAVGTIIMK